MLDEEAQRGVNDVRNTKFGVARALTVHHRLQGHPEDTSLKLRRASEKANTNRDELT